MQKCIDYLKSNQEGPGIVTPSLILPTEESDNRNLQEVNNFMRNHLRKYNKIKRVTQKIALFQLFGQKKGIDNLKSLKTKR